MSTTSLKAAKEAAMKVTAMLVASGQLKPTDVEKSKLTKSNKGSDLFVEEVIINDAPMSARNYLTRSVTQEEISKMSGASVSTKGRYISPTEQNSGTTIVDKPLHLQIQGINQQDVKVAVGRIMHLIMEHTHRKNNSSVKSKGQKNYNNSTPEKVNANSSPPKADENVPILREKVFMPMTPDLNPVEVCARLLGENGQNFHYIKEETGLSVVLRGIGSGYLEADTNQEAAEALHFYLEYPHQEQFNQAKDLVVNLAQTVLAQIQEEQQGIMPHVPINPLQPTIPNPPPQSVPPSANALQPFSTQVIPSTQQVLVQQCPPQIIPAVPPATSSLNPILTQQSVAPLVHVSQSLLPTSAMVATQATANIAEGVAVQTPAISQLITIPVVTSAAETPVLSQQLVQTSAGPQLVQIPHGSQIISTPEGPRLLAVIPSVTSTTAVASQTPITNLNYTRPLDAPCASITSIANAAPSSFIDIEKPKIPGEAIYPNTQLHHTPGVVYLQHPTVEHSEAPPAVINQSFVSQSVPLTQQIETALTPATQTHVVLSQNAEAPVTTEHHPETNMAQYQTPYLPKPPEDTCKTGELQSSFTNEENRIEYQHGAAPPTLPWSQYPQTGHERAPPTFSKPGEGFDGLNSFRTPLNAGLAVDGRSHLEGGNEESNNYEPSRPGFFGPSSKRSTSSDYEMPKRSRANRKDGNTDRWGTASNSNGQFSGLQKSGSTQPYSESDYMKNWREETGNTSDSRAAVPPTIEYNHSMPPTVRPLLRDPAARTGNRPFGPRNPQVFNYQNTRLRNFENRYS